MKLDAVDSLYDSFLAHALSLLFANRPHLLAVHGLRFAQDSKICICDKCLSNFGSYLLGHSESVDFCCEFKEIGVEDLESMVMALEVMLVAKNRMLGR